MRLALALTFDSVREPIAYECGFSSLMALAPTLLHNLLAVFRILLSHHLLCNCVGRLPTAEAREAHVKLEKRTRCKRSRQPVCIKFL